MECVDTKSCGKRQQSFHGFAVELQRGRWKYGNGLLGVRTLVSECTIHRA